MSTESMGTESESTESESTEPESTEPESTEPASTEPKSGSAGGPARGDGPAPGTRFDTKIAVLLRDDLETWQRLNVTAFLVSGLGPQVPEVVGEPYEDADGVGYLPMFRQPVLIFEGTKETLKAAHTRALSRALPRALFTRDLFATGNDHDNRAAVRAVPTTDLDLVGLAVYGPRNAVDKTFKGARMHP